MKQYKLLKEWNIGGAQEEYSLYIVSEQKVMTLDTTREDGLVYDCQGSGDMEWAQRTARHFNIDVPG